VAASLRRLHAIVVLAVAACLGCTTTAVNFVVTDGGGHDTFPDGTDGTSVPDGGSAPDEVGGTASTDAAPADATAGTDAASRVTDIDAQREDADPSAFAAGPVVSGPARYVRYKCCTAANDACFIADQGDDTTCRDAETWTTYATTDCENQGLVVYGVGLYVGC